MSNSPYAKSSIHKSALWKLLQERFPEHQNNNGLLMVRSLAVALGMSHETLYTALRNNALLTRHARTVVEVSQKEGRSEDLHVTMHELLDLDLLA